MEDELQEMLKDSFIKLFTRENVLIERRRIDRAYLIDHISDFGVLYRSSWLRKSISKTYTIWVQLWTLLLS
jgi:hypothetical protein